MDMAVFKIAGMTCQGCVRSATRVLQAVPGVAEVDVSLERGEAKLRYDPAQAGTAAFRKAIESAGFTMP